MPSASTFSITDLRSFGTRTCVETPGTSSVCFFAEHPVQPPKAVASKRSGDKWRTRARRMQSLLEADGRTARGHGAGIERPDDGLLVARLEDDVGEDGAAADDDDAADDPRDPVGGLLRV